MSSILKEIKKLLKQIQVNGQLQIKIAPKENQKKLPPKRGVKRVTEEQISRNVGINSEIK